MTQQTLSRRAARAVYAARLARAEALWRANERRADAPNALNDRGRRLVLRVMFETHAALRELGDRALERRIAEAMKEEG